MDATNQQCPKCDGAMMQGFLLDNTHGGRLISHWAAGPPLSSFWGGLKKPELSLPVGAYRCSDCGYLELYALAAFAPE
jgi:hypothetical protein